MQVVQDQARKLPSCRDWLARLSGHNKISASGKALKQVGGIDDAFDFRTVNPCNREPFDQVRTGKPTSNLLASGTLQSTPVDMRVCAGGAMRCRKVDMMKDLGRSGGCDTSRTDVPHNFLAAEPFTLDLKESKPVAGHIELHAMDLGCWCFS